MQMKGVGRDAKARRTNRQKGSEVRNIFPSMDLPLEIMLQIFFLLPINTIHLCKLVCKSWKSLISEDSLFAANYMRNAPFQCLWLYTGYGLPDDCALLQISENGDRCFRTPIKIIDRNLHTPKDERLQIVGSYNGLTCVLGTTFEDGVRALEQIYILNLISSELISAFGTYDVSNGLQKATIYQFGFIESDNKYKVVRFVFIRKPSYDDNGEYLDLDVHHFDSNHEIFTVGEDDDWRPLPSGSVSTYSSDPCRLLFITFNGVVHWFDEPQMVIRTFGLGEEKGGQISLPSMVEDLEMKQLKVLNDYLSFVDYSVYYDDQDCASEITIWIMKEYGMEESWTKEYVISPVTPHLDLGLPDPDSPSNDLDSDLNVSGMLPTGDILLTFTDEKRYPICYNPQGKEWALFDMVPDVDWPRYMLTGDHTLHINPDLFEEEY